MTNWFIQSGQTKRGYIWNLKPLKILLKKLGEQNGLTQLFMAILNHILSKSKMRRLLMMMKAWMVVSFNDKTFAYCLYCNSDNNPMPTDDIYMDFYTCIITNFTLL
mmetsp:Transcript_16026/g.24269  ORF Transcript_16026/g.24269 Transcript_16026/m.24269 type:complete len:106 (+) Transcript_16026:495-812(+)